MPRDLAWPLVEATEETKKASYSEALIEPESGQVPLFGMYYSADFVVYGHSF